MTRDEIQSILRLDNDAPGSVATCPLGDKNLRRMIQFAEVFSDREIVVLLIRQLTHKRVKPCYGLTPAMEICWRHFYANIPDYPVQLSLPIVPNHSSVWLGLSGT
jgi:hypothetical protein